MIKFQKVRDPYACCNPHKYRYYGSACELYAELYYLCPKCRNTQRMKWPAWHCVVRDNTDGGDYGTTIQCKTHSGAIRRAKREIQRRLGW